MKFRPLHDRVVIERIDAEAKTAGGIIIPDTAQEKPQQGKGDRRWPAQCLFKGSDSPRKTECIGRSARSRFNTFRLSTATIEASPENSRT